MIRELMKNPTEAKTSKTKAEIKKEIREKLPKEYWDSIAEDALTHLGLYLYASTSDAQSRNYKQYQETKNSMTDAYHTAVFDTAVMLGYYRSMLKRQGRLLDDEQ